MAVITVVLLVLYLLADIKAQARLEEKAFAVQPPAQRGVQRLALLTLYGFSGIVNR